MSDFSSADFSTDFSVETDVVETHAKLEFTLASGLLHFTIPDDDR